MKLDEQSPERRETTVPALGRPLVVIDGDDTLWRTEPLYDAVRETVARLVGETGLPSDRWDAVERRCDVANVARLGLTRHRFPYSCVQAYRVLAAECGLAVDPELVARVRATAETVFTEPASLVDDAHDVLRALRDRKYRLMLLTQGDAEVQQRRIRTSSLEGYFDSTHIVGQKTSQTFMQLLTDESVQPEDACSIGNSMRSDIRAALGCGMHAIWIPTHVWEYERIVAAPEWPDWLTAGSLAQVPALLERVFEARRCTVGYGRIAHTSHGNDAV